MRNEKENIKKLKMNIVTFPELSGPCVIFDKNNTCSQDISPNLFEVEWYGSISNLHENAYAGVNPKYLDFDFIENPREYFREACLKLGKFKFIYDEAFSEYMNYLVNVGIYDGVPHITPDGLFLSMEDYFTWQKLYMEEDYGQNCNLR